MMSDDGRSPTISICGGRKPAGSHAVIAGRAADGSLAISDLKNRADASAGRIAIAAFLQHPPAAADRDDDIGDGGAAFLGDEELHFAIAGRTEARQQAFPYDRKVHEVAVALEVEPVALGAGASHGDDVRQIAILAGADERHRRAAPRVLDHPQRAIGVAIGSNPRPA